MSLTNLSQALGNHPEMVLAMMLGVAGMITLVLITLGTNTIIQLRIYFQDEREMELKRELLSQGFSATEVETIICASSQKHSRSKTLERHALKDRSAMANALTANRYRV